MRQVWFRENHAQPTNSGPLRVRGLGQDLEVEVEGNPDARIFKKAHREALRATVCGECGHVGLSTENPKALWETYIKKNKS